MTTHCTKEGEPKLVTSLHVPAHGERRGAPGSTPTSRVFDVDGLLALHPRELAVGATADELASKTEAKSRLGARPLTERGQAATWNWTSRTSPRSSASSPNSDMEELQLETGGTTLVLSKRAGSLPSVTLATAAPEDDAAHGQRR